MRRLHSHVALSQVLLSPTILLLLLLLLLVLLLLCRCTCMSVSRRCLWTAQGGMSRWPSHPGQQHSCRCPHGAACPWILP
jgi:hypothetical protein